MKSKEEKVDSVDFVELQDAYTLVLDHLKKEDELKTQANDQVHQEAYDASSQSSYNMNYE